VAGCAATYALGVADTELEMTDDALHQSGATGYLEITGTAGGGPQAGAQGFIEIRGGDVIVHAPAVAATANVVGEVTVTATGEVTAGGKKVALRGAVSAVVLAEVLRNLLEIAEDPTRKAEINVAVSLLIAVLLVVLGGSGE
jgi:hypothetical protein